MTDLHLRHADDSGSPAAPKPPIHCLSWGTDESNEPGSPLDGSMLASMTLDEKSMSMLSKASQMQIRWDRAMCNELKIPEGYRKVSVLLIKWRNDEDQLRTEEEVRRLLLLSFQQFVWSTDSSNCSQVKQLDHIFSQKFGYFTKVFDVSSRCGCKISCLCTPQTRLNRAVSRFMDKYDHSNNLSIIYYTGHGTYQHKTAAEPGYLRLHASDEESSPWLKWDHAENSFIQNAKGDILTIMDACFGTYLPAFIPSW